MIIKNVRFFPIQLKKYFTFEVQVLDDKNVRRRFRASNYQSTTRVKPFICTMPMRLDEGWNQIQFNLSDFTRRAYGSNYIETLRVTIHANCRIRRIYFSDRLYSEEELPPEFKLFLPIQKQQWESAFKKILQRYFYIFFWWIILSFLFQSLQRYFMSENFSKLIIPSFQPSTSFINKRIAILEFPFMKIVNTN